MEWVCEEVLPREVRKLTAVVEEKDAQIALARVMILCWSSEPRQDSSSINNTGLQGEIRAKDQEIDRRREEVQDLIANQTRTSKAWSIDTILCFVDKKSNEKSPVLCHPMSTENYGKA